jgi:hypothetical protein
VNLPIGAEGTEITDEDLVWEPMHGESRGSLIQLTATWVTLLPCLGHVSGDEAFPSQGNIKTLSERVIELTEYRASLSEYLKAQGKTIHMFFYLFLPITNLLPIYSHYLQCIYWDIKGILR